MSKTRAAQDMHCVGSAANWAVLVLIVNFLASVRLLIGFAAG